ncbi:MAG TPA: hypothetical protein VEV84_07565, partial [Pyrinomonadaceae bacterium]|nr:hypothetical protein [Pyrinomonadaceae bacterium]
MFIKNLSAVSLLILICALSAAAQFTRVVTKSDKFDFGAGGTVSITGAPNGSIHVEPSTRNEIEINAEIKLSAPSEADLGLLEKVTGFLLNEGVGNVAINSVGTNDSKYLKQTMKKFPKTLLNLPFRIDYVIKVPRYCDLQIDNGSGDITVSGIEGNLRINSIESNTRLDLVGGGVNATLQKGSVRVSMP